MAITSTKKGLQLLKKLEARLVEHYGKEDEPVTGWEAFPQVGKCYGSREGCLNEGSTLYRDDTLQGVIDLFYEYVTVIRDAAQEDYPIAKPEWLRIVVEPSYEDTSHIVLYLDQRKRVVCDYDCKAWNFQWPTPDEMAEDMANDYTTITIALAKIDEERG